MRFRKKSPSTIGININSKAAKKISRSRLSWPLIFTIVLIFGISVGMFIIFLPKYQDDQKAKLFTPSKKYPDPSIKIQGIKKIYYPPGIRIGLNQRVAYDMSPPFGGPHAKAWATCMGNIYSKAIRNENAVAALHNGAVWITYNKSKLTNSQIKTLENFVRNQPYLFLSPYPNLSTPISLQSWGHQLKLNLPADERIKQFIDALRLNHSRNVYPEDKTATAYPSVGAKCTPTKGFDPKHPRLFDTNPLPVTAVKMDGTGVKLFIPNI